MSSSDRPKCHQRSEALKIIFKDFEDLLKKICDVNDEHSLGDKLNCRLNCVCEFKQR